VADAEIIPLGTRGRPGRGSGSAKPSASARNLAGSTKKSPRSEKPEAAGQGGTADPEPTPVPPGRATAGKQSEKVRRGSASPEAQSVGSGASPPAEATQQPSGADPALGAGSSGTPRPGREASGLTATERPAQGGIPACD